MRGSNASVLALPKVDLRWAYIGPNNPTPSDLKDADSTKLEQDTIFQLTNDFESIALQVILANGDGPSRRSISLEPPTTSGRTMVGTKKSSTSD